MARMKKKSFTLVELLVSVFIVALILPPVFAIFFSMMRQQIVLISYSDMIKQGENIHANLKHLIEDRSILITDSGFTANVCPLITSPTPTPASTLYAIDTERAPIKLYQEVASPNRIASDSASKTYFLTSSGIVVSNLKFTCSRINDKTPSVVKASYTLQKNAFYKDISLQYFYTFHTREQ